MKNAAKVTAVIVAVFVGLPLVYSIFSPHFSWYFRVWDARLTVDGRPVEGWLHQGGREQILFVTRSSGQGSETYRVWLGGHPYVSDCGDWISPRFPIFVTGDINPPCFWADADENGEIRHPPPRRIIISRPNSVEFTADDGSRVAVSW